MKVKPSNYKFDQRPTIGVFLGDVNAYTDLIWTGIADKAREQEINTLAFIGRGLSHEIEDKTTSNIIYQFANQHNIDGLIILSAGIGSLVSHQELTDFCHQFLSLPIVSVGEQIDGIVSLLIDNQKGLHDLILHLIEVHAYRQIAFIRGPVDNSEAQGRYLVYEQALAEKNIPLNPDLIVQGGFSYQEGQAAARELLQRRVPFDALVSVDDESAWGALNTFQAEGLHIPGDIAVTGFDDILGSQYTMPPLSTVRQPRRKLGMQAFELILDLMRSEHVSHEVTLDTEMVVRQSCGCLPPAVRRVQKMLPLKSERDTGNDFVAQKEAVQQGWMQAIEHLFPGFDSWSEEWILELLGAFYDEIVEGQADVFLHTMNSVLQQAALQNRDLECFHDVLSAMRCQVVPYFQNLEQSRRIEALWQHARILLSDVLEQAQVRRRLQADLQTRMLFEINEEVITTFDLPKLLHALPDALQQLAISFCFLCLNDTEVTTGLDELPVWSRLMMAYQDGALRKLEPDGIRFPTVQLLPDSVRTDRQRFDALVLSLRFQNHYLGHAFFEMGDQDGFIYDALQIQISSAIRGAFLIDQLSQAQTDLEDRVEKRTAELQKEITERSRVEATLRENEQRYRALFEQTNDAVFILDMDGHHMMANHQAADLLGYTIEELIGKHVSEVVAPDEYSDSAEKLQQISSGESLPIYERNFRHKDGHIVPVEINAALVSDPRGNPMHIQSIVRDISKRKRTERILRALNLATLAMRQAITPEEIFAAMGNELKSLGLECTVFRTNPDLQRLFPRYFSYDGKAVSLAEKLLDVEAGTFSISVEQVDVFQKTIWERETVFVREAGEAICQFLPAPLRGLAKKLVDVLGVPRSINAPLVVDDQIMGMLSIQSSDLTAEDIPAVTAFAHQMASTWLKARLMQDLELSLVEQIRTEEFLRESEEKYRTLFELSPEAIFLIGLNGIILDANQAVKSIFNLEKNEVIGRSFLDLGFWDQDEQLLPGYNDLLSRAISGEMITPIEIQLNIDGHLRWAEVHPALLKQDEDVRALQLIIRDITERKFIEQDRQALIEFQRIVATLSAQFINLAPHEIDGAIEQALRIIAEYAGADACSVWMFSDDKLEASKVFGWPSSQKDQKNQRIPITNFPWVFGKFFNSESVNISRIEEIPEEADDMHELLESYQMAAFLAIPLVSEGNVLGSLSIYMRAADRKWSDDLEILLKIIGDIIINALERKRAEQSIRQLNEELELRVIQRTQQLEVANKELEAFAYSVSHDLRAPLRAIDGFSLALIEDYGGYLEDQAASYLQRVRAASQRMGQLIDDLLKLSRVTRSEMSLHEVNLSEMANDIVDELQETEPDRQVNFVIEPDLIVLGDNHLLRIVMFNLFNNAWKFTSKIEQARIEFGSTQIEGQRVFFIQDNGAGFNMAYREKLFGTFQRLHTIKEFDGTGIGLATVKRIILRHGGQIWAEGQIDHGATFYFTIAEMP